MTKIDTRKPVGIRKAKMMIEAGEAVHGYRPLHDGFRDDYPPFRCEADAAAKLAEWVAIEVSDTARIGRVLIVPTMVREHVSHRQMAMGAPMGAMTMVKRNLVLEIKGG